MHNEFIKAYWDSQAKTHNHSFEASWGDLNMIRLEIQTIGQFLSPEQNVLDVGCANGFAAFTHLENGLKAITGVDYSENMIHEAKKRASERGFGKRATFKVGDIQNIDAADNTFDVVYTTRVLINLPNWEAQLKGVKECLRVAKRGGLVIFSEAFWEPLCRLNALRVVANLSPLPEPDFNRYLKQSNLEDTLTTMGHDYESVDFSSLYYLGTRFIRELVEDAGEQTKGFSNPFNNEFFKLEQQFNTRDFGVQKAFVITKR